MAKITKQERPERIQMSVRTKGGRNETAQAFLWWKAKTDQELQFQVLDTVSFLKTQQQYRQRQMSVHARLYGNLPLANFAGNNWTSMGTQKNNLPVDRPTFNVVQSCVDTLTSRITQSKPRPVFLTDGANYKKRNLAKQLNRFTAGEFYQTKAYELGEQAFRDAAVLGDGCVKIYETDDCKVGLERVLIGELYVDANDAFYGAPRCLYHLKLVDRSVLHELYPKDKKAIETSTQAYPDNSGDSQKTISDQVMIAEAWHLPSSHEAEDGRHVIVCEGGVLCDEPWKKKYFPFAMLGYCSRLVGFMHQGLAEQLTGTQIEINKLLITISQSISLVGVPRVFVEDGSKVVKAHLNDQIGAIVTYRGTKPQYEVAPCVPAELYAQLQRLIDYAYQQSGISALAASSQKPAGLNSGEAIRNYDDLQSDRFASISKRYAEFYKDLAYKIIELAKDIAERDGKYQTVYPDKDGTQEIDLPDVKLLEDSFVIQCFDSSSLPRDPAGRLQKVTEMMQAGIIDPTEGRRLLDFPDLEQSDKLATAAKERILKQLDDIVESGKYDPPDPFTDLQQASTLVVQYYNLYAAVQLEESKLEMLRNYQQQVLSLVQQATPPPPPQPMPQAVPEARPTSPMLSQVS